MTQTATDMQGLQGRIRLVDGKLIAARIRRARRDAGLSHDKLAAATGTSRSHLIKLEKALHRPGSLLLVSISEATGKPLDYFLLEVAGEPNPFPDEQAA